MKMARMTAWNRFLFLRHGETDWNLQGRFQGHSDIPLNATGLVQAREAATRLKSQTVHRIVSSPLVRALKTAAIVAEHIGLPIYVDSQFSERSFGSFDGQVIAEVKRQHGLAPSELAHRIFPPDAEKWPQTLARSRAAIATWLDAHPEETILFVAHDGIFRALSEILHGSWRESRHGTPYAFEPGPKTWTITEIGARPS
jgi:glucosyl-3-phosphoglycerate phosphatase